MRRRKHVFLVEQIRCGIKLLRIAVIRHGWYLVGDDSSKQLKKKAVILTVVYILACIWVADVYSSFV